MEGDDDVVGDDDVDDDDIDLGGECSDDDPLTGSSNQRCWTGGEVAGYQRSTNYHHYYHCVLDDRVGGGGS